MLQYMGKGFPHSCSYDNHICITIYIYVYVSMQTWDLLKYRPLHPWELNAKKSQLDERFSKKVCCTWFFSSHCCAIIVLGNNFRVKVLSSGMDLFWPVFLRGVVGEKTSLYWLSPLAPLWFVTSEQPNSTNRTCQLQLICISCYQWSTHECVFSGCSCSRLGANRCITYTCIDRYIQTHIHIYIYIHMCLYVRVGAHIYIYTYRRERVWCLCLLPD